MRQNIQELIYQLREGNKIPSNNAPLYLGLMLERFTCKNLHDSVHKMVLPRGLLEINLTKAEANSILDAFSETILFSNNYSLPEKAALSQTLGKDTRLQSFESVLRFIMENEKVFDENTIYYSLIAMNPTNFKKTRQGAVLKLIEKYQTLAILERFLKSKSLRVVEISRTKISSIEKMKNISDEQGLGQER